MNRRSFLLVGAGTAFALAGCVGRGADEGAGRNTTRTITERSDDDPTTAGVTTSNPNSGGTMTEDTTTEETATEPSTDGSTTRDTDEPTSETVQRRVSLAEADDTEREYDLRIDVELLEATIAASHTARLRVTTTNEGEQRRLSVGTGACTLFNRSRGASEQPGLFLHPPGSDEWIDRDSDRWTRDADPSRPRSWAAIGYENRVYAEDESVTNEYAVWDDYQVESYLLAGTYRFEESVRVLQPDDSLTNTPDREPIAEFDWGFDLTVADPESG
jgi:hypothetical protein